MGGVADLTSARQKQWIMLGTLTYDVFMAGVQFYDNKLIVISAFDVSSNNNDCIQSFDLSNNTTKTYSNVIEHGSSSYGLYFPASYISDSKMTFFGGAIQYSSSIQQTVNLDDIKTSTKVSTDDSVFQDLLVYSYGASMAFANAFI